MLKARSSVSPSCLVLFCPIFAIGQVRTSLSSVGKQDISDSGVPSIGIGPRSVDVQGISFGDSNLVVFHFPNSRRLLGQLELLHLVFSSLRAPLVDSSCSFCAKFYQLLRGADDLSGSGCFQNGFDPVLHFSEHGVYFALSMLLAEKAKAKPSAELREEFLTQKCHLVVGTKVGPTSVHMVTRLHAAVCGKSLATSPNSKEDIKAEFSIMALMKISLQVLMFPSALKLRMHPKTLSSIRSPP